MEDELPFAHSKIYPKSDEEVATFIELKRERSGKCFVYVFAALVLLSICFMIFALIVLRVNIPDVNLSSVRVKNLRYKQATSSSAASFNATFVAEMTIKNTNYGRFELENSTLSVLYQGMKLGDGKIGHESVKERKTQEMTVTVEVRSIRLQDAKNFSSDIQAGLLKLSSFARLTGRVDLLNIGKKRKTREMNCAMTLNLTSSVFQGIQC